MCCGRKISTVPRCDDGVPSAIVFYCPPRIGRVQKNSHGMGILLFINGYRS